MLQKDIDQSILRGVNYLHQHQFPNGEFCTYIGHENSMQESIPDANIFPTSLIGYSLLNLQHIPKVNEMLQLSASYLQHQSMRGGVWNNYPWSHERFKICPADVDNTACASILLKALKRGFPANEEILLLNRNKAKIFYTWYTLRPNLARHKDYWLLLLRELKHPIIDIIFWTKNEPGKNDIDGAVNANALFYLGLNEETRPVISYLLGIIAAEKEADCDKWYRNPFIIYYFFSRILHAGITEMEPIRKPIIERMLKKINSDGSFGEGVLDTALAIITMIKLNYISTELEIAVKYLLRTQGEYGEWPRWALYYGGPLQRVCYGSEEITTAYCMEALSLYLLTVKEKNESI